MAVPTTHHFAGAETGPLGNPYYPSEFAGGQFVGIGSLATPGPHHDKQTYYFDISGTGPGSENPQSRFADYPAINVGTSDWIEISLFFRIENFDATNAANVSILSVLRGGNQELVIGLIEGATSGQWDRMTLFDANSGQVGGNITLQEAMWHQITIKYSRSGSSPVKLWLDGVLKIDETGKDFFDSAGDVVMRLGFKDTVPGEVTPTPTFDTYIGANKLSTDASGSIDDNNPIGIFTVLGVYNDTVQAGTGDFGDTLNSGRWDDSSAVPSSDATHSDYNINLTGNGRAGGVTADDGTQAGPGSDSDADNTMLAYSGIWRYRKDGSSGTSGTFAGKLGFDAVGDSSDQTTEYPFGSIPAAWVNKHVVVDVGGESLADNLQLGFKVVKTGGVFPTQNMQCSFMGGFILHEEAVATRVLIVDGFKRNVG